MKLILGMGVTGLSVANFFTKEKIEYRIADSRKSPPLLKSFIKNKLNQQCDLGFWNKLSLVGVSEIIVSPGIATSENIIIWAKEKKIPIISDIELFSRYVKAPIIGITGSNGKSTVTQMLADIANIDGKNTAICGNIGKAVLDCLADNIDLYIVEISSYHLDYTNKLNLFAAVILNITPDHLDRYNSFEDYVSTKLGIYEYTNRKVVNLDDPFVKNINSDYCFSLKNNNSKCNFRIADNNSVLNFFYKNIYLFNSKNLKIFGKHNMSNILAVLVLAEILSLSLKSMIAAILNFKGLEHRLELVNNIDNIDFFNDSKSTNAISTITAINALSDKYNNLVVIIGGIAKKEDYSAMFNLIAKKVQAVVLIGQSSNVFYKHIKCSKVDIVNSMEKALEVAKIYAKDGAILLSPACASFDMYDDFNARGKHFKKILQK